MKTSTHIVNENFDPETGALTYPLYQTTAYKLPMGERYRYSRESNPTVEELSRKIALIEECPAGTSFSSGMGAITSTFFSLLKPGANLVVALDIFARSFRFAMEFLSNWGVNVTIADPGTDGIISAINSKTDLVFIEGLSNPTLRVNDIREISRVTRENDATLIVDSTFTTPVNQKPYTLGADLVIHSASKFIAGHNDVIAGTVSGREDLVSKSDTMRRTMGPSLDPHAAFLVLRGLKTLKVRMDAINSTAMKIAKVLEEHPLVSSVYYPGLDAHPDHRVAEQILQGYGGVVSFDLLGDSTTALDFISKLRLVMPANTLGGVNSTISHPKTMSHRGLTEEERNRAGIGGNMLRLSVGLEDFDDIIDDLNAALSGQSIRESVHPLQ